MNIIQRLCTPLLLSCILLTNVSCAAETENKKAPEAKDLQQRWEPVLAGVEINAVKPSPISGLWEVQAGPHIFYTNAAGDKLIIGDILSMDKNAPVNLTETEREQARLQAIKKLDLKDFITYPAKDPKHTIYVFTDADCGYCRKFHEQRQAINDAGITINYLAMPRTAPDTPSYNKAIAIWCADDRQKALTEAKSDTFTSDKTCEAGKKIVDNDVALARDLGAQGTPTIILDDGKLIPGYVPTENLVQYFAQIDEQKTQ